MLSKGGSSRRAPMMALVPSSPLRRADPRVKLLLSLCVSLAVMLPLERLVVAMAFYALLLLWARLFAAAAVQVWRLKWILLGIFVLDWLLISSALGVVIVLRLILLAGAFAMFFSTTTPDELRLSLEWMGVPYRYAFSLTLAFQSVNLLDEEWRTIVEAQRSRGAWTPLSGWRNLTQQVRDLVALAVPAIVMTTKRAWAVTEAAYARGFDSPHRRPYHHLALQGLDWALLVSVTAFSAALVLWR
jgi:energy-coupling factor transport system permease protein